jgi:hypothetical protein
MGWKRAPEEKEKHRIVLELKGPFEKAKWPRYRAAVKALAKRFKAQAQPKLFARAGAKRRKKARGKKK